MIQLGHLSPVWCLLPSNWNFCSEDCSSIRNGVSVFVVILSFSQSNWLVYKRLQREDIRLYSLYFLQNFFSSSDLSFLSDNLSVKSVPWAYKFSWTVWLLNDAVNHLSMKTHVFDLLPSLCIAIKNIWKKLLSLLHCYFVAALTLT